MPIIKRSKCSIVQHFELGNYITSYFLDPEKTINRFGVTVGMHVADFGSGIGHFALPLATIVGSNGRVYALDIRGQVISRLKKVAEEEYKLDNLEIIEGNIELPEGIQLRNSSLDAGLLINTLFQVHDKRRAAQEIRRVMKSEAKLLVIDWNDAKSGLGPYERDIIDRDSAEKLFGDEDFNYLEDIDAGDCHYGLVFKNTKSL